MPRNANGDSRKVPFPRRCCPQMRGQTVETLLEAGRETLHPLLFSGDEKRRKEDAGEEAANGEAEGGGGCSSR